MSGGPVQGLQYPSAPAISGLEKVNPSVIAQSEHSPAPASYGKQERSNADATAIVRAPLVSVIVAVYNVEKYLCQCLDSLAYQALNNIEILVVNEASTDNSAAIINDYASQYSQIRVFHCDFNKGKGLATVRNIRPSAFFEDRFASTRRNYAFMDTAATEKIWLLFVALHAGAS